MEMSKEMREALASPEVHSYAKVIIREGLNKDICDVLNDLDYATYLFRQHMNDTLARLDAVLTHKS